MAFFYNHSLIFLNTHLPVLELHEGRSLEQNMQIYYIDLARAKSEALFNIYNFLKGNIKSSNTIDKVKQRER